MAYREEEIKQVARLNGVSVSKLFADRGVNRSAYYRDFKKDKSRRKIDSIIEETMRIQDEINKRDNSELISLDLGFKPTSGKKRTILILSDLHCGSDGGLTPPAWQREGNNPDAYQVQKITWKWFSEAMKNLPDIDACVVNGDAIDGASKITGSTDLIVVDRMEQGEMAMSALDLVPTDKFFFTRGTPYHTGKAEQFEDVLAEKMDGTIKDQLDIQVFNTRINFKHKTGSSGIPHGRATAIAKELMWDKMQSVKDDDVNADVIVRSHAHYYIQFQDSSSTAIITPALQWNSRYGRQQCSGIIDYGFIMLHVYENGRVVVEPVLANIKSLKKEVLTI